MEKYRKVKSVQKEQQQLEPNEVRLSSKNYLSNVIRYAISLFEGNSTSPGSKQEVEGEEKQGAAAPTPAVSKYDTVVLMGMGAAITHVVSVAEILKRRVKGLHQITKIESREVEDVFEPIEMGLDNVTVTKNVASITVTLSLGELDKGHPGYQSPIPEDQVISQEEYDKTMGGRRNFRRGGGRRRGNGRRRGQRDEGNGSPQESEENEKKTRRRRNRRNRRGPRKNKDERVTNETSESPVAAAAAATSVSE